LLLDCLAAPDTVPLRNSPLFGPLGSCMSHVSLPLRRPSDDSIPPVRPAWAYPRGGLGVALRGPLLFFALGALAIPTIDRIVARENFPENYPRFLMSTANHAEIFGNGAGVPFFLAAVWLLDPARRRMIPRLACASWGAGIVANIVKLCVTRMRPYHWLQAGDGGVGEQFGDWFPLAGNPTMLQSFPSAHTATAVGLALGLTALYPRGGKLFGLLAALVAFQRAAGDMHFVSDTLFAGGLALLTCLAIYRWPPLVRTFERFEADAVSDAELTEVRRAA
jgi:membrane-associated phospholipid phosphatase